MTSARISKETLATTGVIGAALLVASCCLAPALFVLFGISAGALAQLGVLEPYRPFFIVAGLLCLTAAGWWIYGHRDHPAACADDQCAAGSPRQRHTRLLFWIGAAAFVAAVVYPYVLSLYLSHGGS